MRNKSSGDIHLLEYYLIYVSSGMKLFFLNLTFIEIRVEMLLNLSDSNY